MDLVGTHRISTPFALGSPQVLVSLEPYSDREHPKPRNRVCRAGLDAVRVVDDLRQHLVAATDAEHRTPGGSPGKQRLAQTPAAHPLQVSNRCTGPRQDHQIRSRDHIGLSGHADIDTGLGSQSVDIGCVGDPGKANHGN